MARAVNVFISSTCSDLVDLRAELKSFLDAEGLITRISENVEGGFYVDPTGDTIQNCLINVAQSDIVVAILDRRYGSVTPPGHARMAGLSATHAELRHARQLGKPVLLFVREPAVIDFNRMADDDSAKAIWIDADSSKNWIALAREMIRPDDNTGPPNWFDQFKSVTDLKQKVLNRIVSQFPEVAGSLAMRADRMVRLTFHDLSSRSYLFALCGAFQNVGVGPALNLEHGLRMNATVIDLHHLALQRYVFP